MGRAIAGPEYFRAEDLIENGVWGERTMLVTKVHPPGTIKAPDGKPIDKEILEFEGEAKRMIVGPLNWRLIKYAAGISSKPEIAGHCITLHATVLAKCFGQENVAALRVRIPPGQWRPFVSVANIGLDITGQKFKNVESQPAPTPETKTRTPEQLINGATGAMELRDMLLNWVQARPVKDNIQKWQDIVRYANAKIIASGWEPSEQLEELDGVLDSIKVEFVIPTEEENDA